MNRYIGHLIALSFVCAATSAASAPNLIITNAKLFVPTPAARPGDALAIENGRISAIGSTAEILRLASKTTRVVDAGGRLVVPGLTEAHVHIQGPFPGDLLGMPDLPFPGPTPDQALQLVAAAQAKPGSGWIVGMIGPRIAADGRNWRKALDAVATHRPVMLRAWWGHGTIYNSAALKTLNITDAAADPPGGWYGRDGSGRLNGQLYEAAESAALRTMMPADRVGQLTMAIKSAGQLYEGWGVTSVHDMASSLSFPETVEAVRAADPNYRLTLYAWGSGGGEISQIWRQVDRAGMLPKNVRVGGTKWILDGTPFERNALMREPYADKPDARGRSNYTDAELREILETAIRRPEGLSLHVVGDGETARLFKAMMEIAPPSRWRAKRVRIEHGDGIAPDLMVKAKTLGVVVIQNPLHLDSPPVEAGRPMIEARLGLPRAQKRLLLQSLLRAGVPLAFGSDADGAAVNPFLNMMLAVQYRQNPAEALTREQALEAYTSGPAFAERQEGVRGKLAAGMVADLAVLSQDVLTVPLAALPATRSIMTIVGGKIVLEQGDPPK